MLDLKWSKYNVILCKFSVVLDLNQAVPSLCYWKNCSPENKNVVICQPCCFSHIWNTRSLAECLSCNFPNNLFMVFFCYFYSLLLNFTATCSMLTWQCPFLFTFIHFHCTEKSNLENLLSFCVLQKKKKAYGIETTWQHDNMRTFHFWINYSFKTCLLMLVRFFPQNQISKHPDSNMRRKKMLTFI